MTASDLTTFPPKKGHKGSCLQEMRVAASAPCGGRGDDGILGVDDRRRATTGAGMSAMRRIWGAALLVLLVTDGQPAPARAPKDGAAQLDALAKRAYRDGNFADALAAFEGAYEADPLPRFLYNLGRCHQKLGDMARASHFFERYLDTAGKAKDRKEVKALATMLRIKLRKEFSARE